MPVIKLLLDRGAELQGEHGIDTITRAISYGRCEALLLLLSATSHTSLHHLQSLHSASVPSPLFIACNRLGSADMVRLLLDRFGYDALVTDNKKQTAFHRACQAGNIDMAKVCHMAPLFYMRSKGLY